MPWNVFTEMNHLLNIGNCFEIKWINGKEVCYVTDHVEAPTEHNVA